MKLACYWNTLLINAHGFGIHLYDVSCSERTYGVMLDIKDVDEAIRLRVALLASYIHLSNQHNLQDINVFSEKIAGNLLNLIWGLKLKDLNTYEDQNFPGIDLGDEQSKICVQVTSTDKRTKIDGTIKTFEAKGHYKKFNKLRIVILKTGMVRYQKEFKTNGKYTFSKTDALCLDDLYKSIKSLDDEKIRMIKDFLCEAIPLTDDSAKTAEIMLLKNFFQNVGMQDEKHIVMLILTNLILMRKK